VATSTDADLIAAIEAFTDRISQISPDDREGPAVLDYFRAQFAALANETESADVATRLRDASARCAELASEIRTD
jgi:hypothetical protein